MLKLKCIFYQILNAMNINSPNCLNCFKIAGGDLIIVIGVFWGAMKLPLRVDLNLYQSINQGV
jgi:hypothetical protein